MALNVNNKDHALNIECVSDEYLNARIDEIELQILRTQELQKSLKKLRATLTALRSKDTSIMWVHRDVTDAVSMSAAIRNNKARINDMRDSLAEENKRARRMVSRLEKAHAMNNVEIVVPNIEVSIGDSLYAHPDSTVRVKRITFVITRTDEYLAYVEHDGDNVHPYTSKTFVHWINEYLQNNYPNIAKRLHKPLAWTENGMQELSEACMIDGDW